MENNEVEKRLHHLEEEVREELKEIQSLEHELEDENRRVCITVNAEEKEVHGLEISYKKVVELAFGCLLEDGQKSYTVTYKKGPVENPEGSLAAGQSVKIKNGMRFNVTQTNKS